MGSDTGYDTMRSDPSGQTGGIYGGPNGMSPYISSNESLGLPSASSGYYTDATGQSNPGTAPAPGPWQGPVASTGPTWADYNVNARLYGNQQAAQMYADPQNALNSAVTQGQNLGYGTDILGAVANYNMQSRFANQNAGFQRSLLANQVAGNQLDKQGNQIDVGANARQPGFLTALHNIAGQQFDVTRQGEFANAGQNRRALESNLTGRGAFTSVGGQQGRFDIAGNLLRQVQGTNLDQQGETTKYGESMAQTEDQRQHLALAGQQLDLKAKDLGINGQQLEATLQQGLERMGLDKDMSVADLMNKINSNNLQDAAQAKSVYNDAVYKYGDFFSRQYPGPAPGAAPHP